MSKSPNLRLSCWKTQRCLAAQWQRLCLKATRLARLAEDDEASSWLHYERHGYVDDEPIARRYLSLTSRWINMSENKAYFAGISTQESVLDGFQEELNVIKAFQPSGTYAALQFQDQQTKVREVTNKMLKARVITSAVRAQVQAFAARIYYESLFSHQARSIFEEYQTDVDAILAAKAAKAFERLPQAFQRLGAGDSEAISHALTTCRRVVESFSDSVFPPRKEPFHMGTEKMEVGHAQPRNRLRAYIYERIGKSSRYDRLNKTLSSLSDRLSSGVHSDVDVGEARALVLQTYLLLGEILSLAPLKAAPS